MENLIRKAQIVCDNYSQQSLALAEVALAEMSALLAAARVTLSDASPPAHTTIVEAQAILDDHHRGAITAEQAMTHLREAFAALHETPPDTAASA